MKMTPEQKAQRREARKEAKRLEDLELERQVEEIIQARTRPPVDSSNRMVIPWNSSVYLRHKTGQTFRGHCGR